MNISRGTKVIFKGKQRIVMAIIGDKYKLNATKAGMLDNELYAYESEIKVVNPKPMPGVVPPKNQPKGLRVMSKALFL